MGTRLIFDKGETVDLIGITNPHEGKTGIVLGSIPDKKHFWNVQINKQIYSVPGRQMKSHREKKVEVTGQSGPIRVRNKFSKKEAIQKKLDQFRYCTAFLVFSNDKVENPFRNKETLPVYLGVNLSYFRETEDQSGIAETMAVGIKDRLEEALASP